jgi:sucrose 6(F)-phosphate phosphorylase
MSVRNQVQLITYPDSLGGNLKNLNQVLDKFFPGLFEGGIHILPPFPSSGDRGFAPLTYLEIEPQFGTWNEIKQISKNHSILLDLMVNHISAKSKYFQDFIEKGRASQYSDLFITLDKIWPDGIPVKKDIDKIFLRRPEPYSEFQIKSTGKVEKVWTTFGKTYPSEQIDLDVNSPQAKDLILRFFENFSDHGVSIVRLDAVGYVIKKPGTTFFFVEPEIYQFLDWITGIANSLKIDLLPEIHADYETQFRLAEKGYWVYDFVLPYMVLDALFNKNSTRINEYLRIRPHHQFTMLDCHDGIPIKPDLNGLYKSEDAKNVVDVCLSRGGNLSLILSPEHKDPDGFDVHQIRGTLYSLLGENDDLYLAARAIQFFTPGIPQVYYVGLLAGINDEMASARTGDGREINRHNFSMDEIEVETQKPIVKRLIDLIRLRNTHPAFNGEFIINPGNDHEISLTWTNGNDSASLFVDLVEGRSKITYSDKASGNEVILE